MLAKLAVEGVKTPIKRIDRFTMIINPKKSRISIHSKELLKARKCEHHFLGTDEVVTSRFEKAKAQFWCK